MLRRSWWPTSWRARATSRTLSWCGGFRACGLGSGGFGLCKGCWLYSHHGERMHSTYYKSVMCCRVASE